MAANATDLLQEVGLPGTATTLSSPGYTIGDTSITVGSTAGWPTATGVTFAIDRTELINDEEVRIEGSYCEFVGVVSSGTSVTSVSKVFGPAQDYPSGASTRVYIPVSSERENRIVEWGLTHANQDGTLKSGTVSGTSLATSAILLGSASATVDQSSITSIVDATSLTSTVTVPAGGRSVKISWSLAVSGSAADGIFNVLIKEGATTLQTYQYAVPNGTNAFNFSNFYKFTPSAGSHTYKLQVAGVTMTMKLENAYSTGQFVVEAM